MPFPDHLSQFVRSYSETRRKETGHDFLYDSPDMCNDCKVSSRVFIEVMANPIREIHLR